VDILLVDGSTIEDYRAGMAIRRALSQHHDYVYDVSASLA